MDKCSKEIKALSNRDFMNWFVAALLRNSNVTKPERTYISRSAWLRYHTILENL